MHMCMYTYILIFLAETLPGAQASDSCKAKCGSVLLHMPSNATGWLFQRSVPSLTSSQVRVHGNREPRMILLPPCKSSSRQCCLQLNERLENQHSHIS